MPAVIEPPGELRDDQICNLIVDGRAEKNNIVFEESRVDIESAFTTRRLLDDHWYEGHRDCEPFRGNVQKSGIENSENVKLAHSES